MSKRCASPLLFALLLSSCAISQKVTQRYGNRAGQAAERATDLIVSWGPTLGGNGRISSAGADGAVSAGLFASAVVLAAEPVRNTARGYNVKLPAIASADLVAHLGVSGGYIFRNKTGFVDLHLGAGYWLFSAGLVIMGVFGDPGSALALGPELTFHLRLGTGTIQHELQFYLRGDFFVTSDTPSQGSLGLRFMFDLQG